MAELLPSVKSALDDAGILYKVLACDPELADTAAFCEHYNFSMNQAANTILVASRKVKPTKYALCVVLGTSRLDVNKAVCRELDVKKASFADAEITKELTGMLIGGVTIFGITDVPIFVDSAVLKQKEIIMGGGNRSSKLLLDPLELKKLQKIKFVNGLAKEKNENN